MGAALLGIGGVSLLVRNVGAETFRAMLDLKLIWSGAAIVGMLLALWQGVATRDSLIISRSARDADPLTCDPDGGFTSFGTVTSWVDLP